MKTKLNTMKININKRVKKGKYFKNVTIWEELPKIAQFKNKPMGLNKDDEIIYS